MPCLFWQGIVFHGQYMTEHRSHHLIYGHLNDYLTGEKLLDTDDERIRQKLARMMIEEKGYRKEELETRLTIETLFNRHFVVSTIDLTVNIESRRFMILRYGPGSLVSRERSAIAAARVLEPRYRIPLAVVTNGIDAELLDTATGNTLGYGLEAIPTRKSAQELIGELTFQPPLEKEQKQRELRVLNAFDLERCCL